MGRVAGWIRRLCLLEFICKLIDEYLPGFESKLLQSKLCSFNTTTLEQTLSIFEKIIFGGSNHSSRSVIETMHVHYYGIHGYSRGKGEDVFTTLGRLFE